MARRRMQRSQGRRSSPRTAWTEAPINEFEGTLTSAALSDDIELYDAGGASKFGDNYGGGDWVVDRLIGSVGVTVTTPAAATALVKVCFGVGMVNPKTGIQDAAASGAANPITSPELSWLLLICCYINTDSVQVERCEFDVRGKRIIGPQSRIVAVAATISMPAVAVIDYSGNFRFLMRQKGSRV